MDGEQLEYHQNLRCHKIAKNYLNKQVNFHLKARGQCTSWLYDRCLCDTSLQAVNQILSQFKFFNMLIGEDFVLKHALTQVWDG